jgi:hypothetical protein
VTVTAVAPVALTVNVELAPAVIVVGFAVMLTVALVSVTELQPETNSNNDAAIGAMHASVTLSGRRMPTFLM